MSEATLPISDQLIRTTARIVCKGGEKATTGTSFFFRSSRVQGKSIPLLITNRHVVIGSDVAEVSISVVPKEQPSAKPSVLPVGFPRLQNLVMYHPDPHVDLAAIPLAAGLGVLHAKNLGFANIFVGDETIATDELLADCCAVEDLVMIGYPNGIWDSKNNRPIVRRAISATPIWEDYEGTAKFLIDCACFPGSSGSPVYLMQQGAITRRQGVTLGGSRVALAGVLHGGFLHLAEGEVVQSPIATLQSYQAKLSIPNSVGICIKASQVQVLIDHVAEIAAKQAAA